MATTERRADLGGQGVSEHEARAVAEAARETEWKSPSFARELFAGKLLLDLVYPYPEVRADEEERAHPFFERLDDLLVRIDSERIDREREIPEWVFQELRDIGAFGIKIPREYGGLGLSQRMYVKAIGKVTSVDGSLTALLSAHQSIGLPQPLHLFGTDEQKRKYFPRLARGAISAFALTEDDVGSDPARLTATAEPTDDGETYILNGEKLWCTNGTIAELIVVMARTGPRSITAFIVEADWPGVKVVQRCHFMGLNAMYNALIQFRDVRVPRENIIWKEGAGLKMALTTLNTGRLTLPSSAAWGVKRALELSRKFAAERVQWGAPVGKHDAIAQMLGAMAANAFALDTIADISSAMADRENVDIRLEAAIAKLYNTDMGWQMVDDALQIHGGRGYERADSMAARGEPAIPVERMVRDFRINRIFEGTSEIMRLFTAREALDMHLQVAGDLLNPKAGIGTKLKAMLKAGAFYAWWYPSRWIGWGYWPRYNEFGALATHIRFVERSSRRLARTLFHAMVRFGPGLEKRQAVLFRLVDVGAELFAMTVTCSRAVAMARHGEPGAIEVADIFCRHRRRRVRDLFRGVFWHNDDVATYKLARRVLDGDFAWLEAGMPDAIGAAGDEQVELEPQAAAQA